MSQVSEWDELNRTIYERLDIIAEWKKLGLKIASDRVTDKGWIRCYALDRDEQTASAGICVDGERRGHYKDHCGKYSNLIAFAALKNTQAKGDWVKQRNEFAKQLGLTLPQTKEKHKLKAFCQSALGGKPTAGQCQMYCDYKDGVLPKSLLEIGVLSGSYPSNIKPESRTVVFAAPMYGSKYLADGPPTGYHLFAVDSRHKVRKYAGQGKPYDELKTLSLGDGGLMGYDGLTRLESATHVWIVEGVSDLLAVQSVIDTSSSHVVVTAGGCSQHPKDHWINPHFAGKVVYVCFDVGDADDQGQKGAKVWCAAMARVAREVRNVTLPEGDGGKNDLRAWLVAGNRTYADMLSLASVSPPWEESSSAERASILAQSSPEQNILDKLGCIVSGQIEGTNGIEIHSTRTGQRMIVRLSSFMMHDAAMMFGGDVAQSVISTLREPEPGKHSLSEVRMAIASAACGKVVSSSDALGCGLWEIGGDIVLIGKNFAYRYTRDRKFERLPKPIHGGKRFDYSKQLDWYEPESMSYLLEKAADPAWRERAVREAIKVFKMWDNWEFKETNPEVAAGLVLATWVQTMWDYRPLVSITGETGSGKSTFVDSTLGEMFNGLTINVGRPSEAGVRHKVGNTAGAVIIDELDKAKKRDEVLTLLRTATDGVETTLGTADGKGQGYILRHVCWCAGIDSGISEEGDRNRYISLTLKRVDRNRSNSKRLIPPLPMVLRDLGHRLSAAAIYTIREAKELAARVHSNVKTPGVNTRYIEGLSVPAAMLSLNLGWSEGEAEAWVESVASERKLHERQTSDEEELIEVMLGSKVTESGRQHTISSLIHAVMSNIGSIEMAFSHDEVVRACDADRMLQANGIRVDAASGTVLINAREVTRFLLQNTRFATIAIAEILDRIPGASRDMQRVSKHTKRCISLPIEALMPQAPTQADE